MPRKTGASRKPDMYAMLRLTDDMPVLPKVVKRCSTISSPTPTSPK